MSFSCMFLCDVSWFCIEWTPNLWKTVISFSFYFLSGRIKRKIILSFASFSVYPSDMGLGPTWWISSSVFSQFSAWDARPPQHHTCLFAVCVSHCKVIFRIIPFFFSLLLSKSMRARVRFHGMQSMIEYWIIVAIKGKINWE